MAVKVLLVDDEKLERILIRKGFAWEKYDFEIIGEASSGQEALEFIRYRQPDVVITDISMPHMNGLELTEKILKSIPQCYVVIVTSYREFEYARKAIQLGVEDFLLKPVNMDEVKTVVERIKSKMEQKEIQVQEAEHLKQMVLSDQDIMMESFFQRLVENRITEDEGIHRLMAYDCEMMLKQCICCNIQINEKNNLDISRDKIEYILNVIRKKSYENSICFVHFMKNIILYFMSGNENEIKNICIQLQKEIYEESGIENTIGISHFNSGFVGIVKSYEQSLKSLDASILIGRNTVITYEKYSEIVDRENEKVEIDWDDFLFCIQNSRIERVEAYIKEYIEQIRTGNVLDREYLGLLCMNMITKVGSTLNRYGKGLEQVLGRETIYDDIRKIKTVDDANRYLNTNLHYLIQYHENRREKKGNKLIENALQFIHKNLFNPELSLGVVANNIFINDSYLSRVFKKEMGVSLIEYITKKRIEESILLLNTTDMKVYEIAEKIGFRDPHYFSICFKKYVGITIKQYKDNPKEK